jgi:hypothetical protein
VIYYDFILLFASEISGCLTFAIHLRDILMANSSTNFRIPQNLSLFSSLRYDPQLLSCPANTAVSGTAKPSPFYCLLYHRDRMLAAANHFAWPSSRTEILQSLEVYTSKLEEAVRGYLVASKNQGETLAPPLKVRFIHSYAILISLIAE